MSNEVNREQSLRRKLRRNGYLLRKTPSRSSQREILSVGFMVVNADTNCVIFGSDPWLYSATLEQVEYWASEV